MNHTNPRMYLRHVILFVTTLSLVFSLTPRVSAQSPGPVAQATEMRATLLDAQLRLPKDRTAAQAAVDRAADIYRGDLASTISSVAPAVDAGIRRALHQAQIATQAGDERALSLARGSLWTGMLNGAYQIVIHALTDQDLVTAKSWLLVREFRQANRLQRLDIDATIAMKQLAEGTQSVDDAIRAVRADLLGAYQARLSDALDDLRTAEHQGFTVRSAELAGLANGYFAILSPVYSEQNGAAATANVEAMFQKLAADVEGGTQTATLIASIEQSLTGFRAAPLSVSEQRRRAGQMLRYLKLVPIEYARGVHDGQVTLDLEIREAITFHDGAYAAFIELYRDLAALNPELAQRAQLLFSSQAGQLKSASAHSGAPDPEAIQASTGDLLDLLHQVLPSDWQQQNTEADFDAINVALNQMMRAVTAGEYGLADSSRVEAYAILESGPEARLVAFAPQSIAPIEDLFWYGQSSTPGLAYLLERGATRTELTATHAELVKQLAAAQTALKGDASPAATSMNASIIVFREGLEAVVILAALLASMVGARRTHRKPMALGVLLAFVASALTWWLAQTILSSFRAYGERLEAVVSLIAIGVLLLITNWFLHRVYWTDWMADLHKRKKAILGGAVGGQVAGFLMLGFTSVYREGFETVLFLQALVLESGILPVLYGVAIGLACVFAVGWLTFKLQSRLPYKQMLVATGVLIGVVLLVMVGSTVHVMQVVGWLPIHPVRWLTLPYWSGLWFGIYPTWEGFSLQALAAFFVIGSYFWAEHVQKHANAPHTTMHSRPPHPAASTPQSTPRLSPGSER